MFSDNNEKIRNKHQDISEFFSYHISIKQCTINNSWVKEGIIKDIRNYFEENEIKTE